MTKVQKMVILVFFSVFFLLACFGVYEEMGSAGWNGFSYALFVVPSITVLVGLSILYIGQYQSLGKYLRAVWVPVILAELILLISGGIHYKNLLSREAIKWLQFVFQPDFFTQLGFILILLMCLYGLVYLIGRVSLKKEGN
ncbi:hypothetical protein [Risungbinella massiliensis]|uniref:hypothetical protein n=1 Tax=Risungbinella massiliensis TaxID=1329796 RepID=UPI0005CBF884|nr:hypothetical protein [Risungbinella massiliensis]